MDDRDYRAAVDAYGDMVYRIALNQTRCTADAEDVTQSVFLKLYTRPPEDAGEPDERLKHWLIRVTVNECKSLWRTAWRRKVQLGDVPDLAPAFAEPDHQQLYDALAQLPDACRIVVHLFYFEGYATREISEILGVREPTVRTRLVRARKMLRQQLKEAWEDD